MRTHRTQGIKTFLSSHHENAEAGVEGNRANVVSLGSAYTDDWRGLIEHVRGEITESEYARAQPSYTQRGCTDLNEPTPIQSGAVTMNGRFFVVFWNRPSKSGG